MFKLPTGVWICNAAAGLIGGWGKITQRAKDAGCSRETVYQHKKEVERVVAERQEGGPTRKELITENQQLKQENKELWDAYTQAIDFPESKQQRFAATAVAMGLSLSQVRELLRILLCETQCPSRSTIGRWVAAAAERAGPILQILDRKAKELVLVICLDEIFLHRRPLLVGVEPHSMAWVIGQREEDCRGKTWLHALTGWNALEHIVSDAGSGLSAGIKLFEQSRPASAPKLDKDLDVFHIKKEATTVLGRIWRQAERTWKRLDQAERALDQMEKQGTYGKYRAARLVKSCCQQALKAYMDAEEVDNAWKQVSLALNIFRPDGQLNDRAQAEQQIIEAFDHLQSPEWWKVAHLLEDDRSLTFLDRLHRQLHLAEPREEVRDALVRLYWLRRRRHQQDMTDEAKALASLHCQVQSTICQKLDANWVEAYQRVARVISHTVRASSVVECMNSVIRMHQARHRNLTQPMIDLKRLYWNCHQFREGKRRKQSPYRILGMTLPTHDWWVLDCMPPDQLAQEVSGQKVAA